MAASPRNLTRRILLPLTAAAAIFVLAFLVLVDSVLSSWTDEGLRARVRAADAYIDTELRHHHHGLAVLSAALAHDRDLRDALAQADHEGLQRIAHRYLDQITGTELSELLILAPDRTLMTWVEGMPADDGRPMRLKVVDHAEQAGTTAVGLAVCSHGRLRLWSALPVYDRGQRLLAFVVLATNIDEILHSADRFFDLRHLVIIDKGYIGGIGADDVQPIDPDVPPLDSTPYRHLYAVDSSLPEVPPALHELLVQDRLQALAQGVRIGGTSGSYFSGTVPLEDIEGNLIGRVVTLKEISAEEGLIRQVAFAVGGVGLLLGGVLYLMLYRTTRHTERELDRTHAELEDSHRVLAQAYRDWKDSIDAIGEPIFLHDAEYRILRANRAYTQCAGMPLEAILGKPYWQVFPLADGPLAGCATARSEGKAQATGDELQHRGRSYVSRGFPVLENGDYRYSVHILEDITERVQMTESLRRENRARRIVSASNQTLIRAVDEELLAQRICDIVTGIGEYRMAFVAARDVGNRQRIVFRAASGVELERLHELNLDWLSETSVARCLRSGEPQVTQTLRTQSQSEAAWLHERFGCDSVLALPLTYDQVTSGALVICSAAERDFNAEEQELLSELAADLAFGLVALRSDDARRYAEHQRLQLLEKLESTLENTVQAMAAALEARDPYTAGHQRRVAELAATIARDLGLPAEEVEAVRMAGILHDIGKIYVPAEILSKPGQLIPIEFELVKTHVDVSYDILKAIDFPWPVAEIVYQHHERLDGSGYPRGLKGDEILPGSRILAVADVIEAMGTHRPYRPGLSIDAALEEIAAKRGSHFDAAVVDVCLKLFREKGYAIDAV